MIYDTITLEKVFQIIVWLVVYMYKDYEPLPDEPAAPAASGERAAPPPPGEPIRPSGPRSRNGYPERVRRILPGLNFSPSAPTGPPTAPRSPEVQNLILERRNDSRVKCITKHERLAIACKPTRPYPSRRGRDGYPVDRQYR